MFLVSILACRFTAPRNPIVETTPITVTESAPLTPTQPQASSTALEYKTGRNDYTLVLENVPRKYIIYVPAGYDPNKSTSVVFMFHGSNQSGQLMYEVTGWAAKADAERFIVVYPTSWKYLITDSNKVEDKWNGAGLFHIVVPGTELKDDVIFVRKLIEQLQATFNIDNKRIYASGFSNGGGFVISRLMLEMNDVFAAFTTSGAALMGEAQPDKIPQGINASLYSVIGNNDQKISELTGYALPFPVRAEEIASHDLFRQMIANTTTALSLDPSYEVRYEEPGYVTMTFNKSLMGANNEYIFRMAAKMGHVYPSGDNNRSGLNAADLFWDFFTQHVKP
jgi:poly(3-hydroxybutyrate) depolymerase